MLIYSSLMAGLHHLSAFTVVACVAYEFIAYRRELSVAEARRIQSVDTWYGISAGAVMIAGLLRVFFFEKGANYYGANTIFWLKMGLFLIVGLVSIYPTIRFIRWSPILKEGSPIEVPEAEYRRIRLFLWLEMIGLALILFAALAMARGIGM